MVLGRTLGVALVGLTGHVVDVEAHLAPSLPAFTLVGLPDASLAESRDRVRAAVTSSGMPWPNRRITVNLSPATLPKSGSGFDLAIAVATLAGAEVIDPVAPQGVVHLGELGLDGRLRPVRGVLPAVAAAVAAGRCRVVVAEANVAEARLVPGAEVVGARSLAEVAAATAPTSRSRACRRSRRSRHSSSGARSPRWISPTSWARRTRARASRSPPRAATTCCSSDRPARARRCW